MRIYIGIPIHGGAGGEFIGSLLKTHAALHMAGHDVEVDLHTGCSVLPKARNEIVRRFVDSGFDKLVFIDSDMEWEVESFFKLIDSDHWLCGIDYRKKKDEVSFTGTLTGEEKEGWLRAFSVGTGLMCISQEVTRDMMQAYPELRYVNEDGKVCFSLFDFCLHKGEYWGEDTTFCRRWVETGGEVAILSDACTSHIGMKRYTGNRAEDV